MLFSRSFLAIAALATSAQLSLAHDFFDQPPLDVTAARRAVEQVLFHTRRASGYDQHDARIAVIEASRSLENDGTISNVHDFITRSISQGYEPLFSKDYSRDVAVRAGLEIYENPPRDINTIENEMLADLVERAKAYRRCTSVNAFAMCMQESFASLAEIRAKLSDRRTRHSIDVRVDV